MSTPSMPHAYSRRDAASVLAALIAVSVTLNVVILPFTQVADPIQKTFGIDDLKFSFLLGTFFALPTMAMAIGGGWLADQFSRRRLLIGAMLLWTGGAVWTALAPSYEQLALGRLVVAASAGIKFPLAMTWISDAFPPQRRGRAVGALLVVMNIGPAICASIGGVVLQAAEAGGFAAWPGVQGLEPWRIALTVLALSNLLVLPWVATLRDGRGEAAEASSTVIPAASRSALPWAVLGGLVLASALLSLADTANLAWLPTVLRRQHGFDAQQAGFAFGLITTCAGLFGSLLGGYVGDWVHARRGSRGRMWVCAATAAASAPLLLAFAGDRPGLLIAALVAGGILSVMAMTLGYVVIQGILPPARRGVGTGIAHAMTNLAAASAPTLVAFAAAHANAGPGALGVGVATITVAAFALAAILFAALAATSPSEPSWSTTSAYPTSPVSSTRSA